jgi:hypothetical protein
MAANDPNFGSVVALLHCDGADNGTTFTDVAGHTFTRTGNTVTKTGEKKYGSASVYLDGAGDNLSSATNADWNLGTGDFTVEFWFYPQTGGHGSAWSRLLQIGPNQTNGGLWIVSTASANPMTITVQGVRSQPDYFDIVTAGATISNDSWHHLALVKASGVYTLYIDGASYGSSTPSPAYTHVQGALWFGNNNLATESFKGYLDDIRITKGVARYTDTFTPPTAALPDYGRYLAGTITEDTDHTDFVVRAHRLDTGALITELASTGGAYEIPITIANVDYTGPVMLSAYQKLGTAWAANTAYASGAYVFPPDPVTDPHVFKCTTAGTSHATTEPTWDTTPGNTTSDGTVTWTCQGRMVQPLLQGPLIPSI